jgi:hypothetical protein
MGIQADPISVFGVREAPDTTTDAQLPISVPNSHASVVDTAVEKYGNGCSGPGEKPGHSDPGTIAGKISAIRDGAS